jgi:hypothetical protein
MNRNNVTRVNGGTSLFSTGVLVEKIDSEVPTLYDALARILEPFMCATEWSKIAENIPLYKKMKHGTCIFVLTEDNFAEYNCLIANVHTNTEKTGIIKCLYSDDEDFNPRKLPFITNKVQYDSIKNGILHFIKNDKTYVVQTTTKFVSGANNNHLEIVTDYAFYIPTESLLQEGR